MNRITTPARNKTSSRLGKRPYLYSEGSQVVAQTSTSSPSNKTLKRTMDSAESIPAHWQQVTA